MSSGSMYAGFVLALSFHHRDLEPDCVEVSTRGGGGLEPDCVEVSTRGGGGGAYARDKNTSARLSPKNSGGAYVRGGAYLRDTTVLIECSQLCAMSSK